jgi:hypothetical protein
MQKRYKDTKRNRWITIRRFLFQLSGLSNLPK